MRKEAINGHPLDATVLALLDRPKTPYGRFLTAVTAVWAAMESLNSPVAVTVGIDINLCLGTSLRGWEVHTRFSVPSCSQLCGIRDGLRSAATCSY